MTNPNDLVIATGKALWGDNWQAPISRALGVNKATVQDWRQNRYRPSSGVVADLAIIAEERQGELEQIVKQLRHYIRMTRVKS